jgi:hypothetical protein
MYNTYCTNDGGGGGGDGGYCVMRFFGK